MTSLQFDSLLANHCAPALAGIKSANLISIKRESAGGLERLLTDYNRVLMRYGIRMEVLGSFERYILLLVYRPELLWKVLRENRDFLWQKGYAVWGGLDCVLTQLKRRCREHSVPHEIGLFLNYPLEDVVSFMEGDSPCKLCGYWRVYHDVPFAMERFREFTLCREDYSKKIQNGKTLFQIIQNNQTFKSSDN
jgi:hypothetical protein